MNQAAEITSFEASVCIIFIKAVGCAFAKADVADKIDPRDRREAAICETSKIPLIIPSCGIIILS